MENNIILPSGTENPSENCQEIIRPFSIYNSDTHRNRELWIIVALGRDNAIGRNGNLIWRLPKDLPRFKELTMGHPVIMGRLTFESLPKGALPGRRNIVITRNTDFHAPDVEVARTPEEALAICSPDEQPFVIGGGKIYESLLPYSTRLYLTRVEDECADADTFFPEIDESEWVETQCGEYIENSDGIRYRFEEWKRR